jgi:hypothetical protein
METGCVLFWHKGTTGIFVGTDFPELEDMQGREPLSNRPDKTGKPFALALHWL